MLDEEKPPDDATSPVESTAEEQKPDTNTFPLKNIFEDTLQRAREIRKKYSGEQITGKEE